MSDNDALANEIKAHAATKEKLAVFKQTAKDLEDENAQLLATVNRLQSKQVPAPPPAVQVSDVLRELRNKHKDDIREVKEKALALVQFLNQIAPPERETGEAKKPAAEPVQGVPSWQGLRGGQ